jgi:hypothetical protein
LLRKQETCGGFLTNGRSPGASTRRFAVGGFLRKRKSRPSYVWRAPFGTQRVCNVELNVGRRSACGTTHGATDTQQIDVPAHDEHGVRNNHLCRITHFCVVCPAKVSHAGVNISVPRGYSAARVKSCNGTVSAPHRGPSAFLVPQPCRTQLSGGSAASCPASCADRCWQSHQVPPGQSWWCRWRQGTQIMLPIVPAFT